MTAAVGVRVLLVEDNAFDRELARRSLASLTAPTGPAHVVCAPDWASARAQLATETFDLVLLDHYLPQATGLDVLRELQGQPHPPVIMITGQDDVDTAIETMRAGAVDYVSKTADWQRALLLAITRVVERERLARELEEARTKLALQVAELERQVAARTAVVQAQATEIEGLYLRLEEATRVKSEIVANVSHELRTPLNVILGYADLLGETIGPATHPDAGSMLDTVRGQAEQMRRLVDSLLALNRLQDGSEGLALAPCSLPALLAELVAEAETLNTGGRLTVSCTAPPEPCEIVTDRRKLRAIGYHLLTNAIKFTPAGRVDVRALRTADGGVVLTVSDTGMGLAPAERAAVFDEFHQLDGTTTRRHAGMGVGLGIVKRYAALLQGTVRVDDSAGGGSTFIVTLPGLSRNAASQSRAGA